MDDPLVAVVSFAFLGAKKKDTTQTLHNFYLAIILKGRIVFEGS
jgi:hypothetical protein